MGVVARIGRINALSPRPPEGPERLPSPSGCKEFFRWMEESQHLVPFESSLPQLLLQLLPQKPLLSSGAD